MKHLLVMMHAVSHLWRCEHVFQMYTDISCYLLRVSFWKGQRIAGQWIAKCFFSIRIVVVKRRCIQALNICRQEQYIALQDLSHSCAINVNQKSKIKKKEDVAANHTLISPHSSMSISVIHNQYQNRKKYCTVHKTIHFLSTYFIYVTILLKQEIYSAKYMGENINAYFTVKCHPHDKVVLWCPLLLVRSVSMWLGTSGKLQKMGGGRVKDGKPG